jgi:predicted enzyme related to lactoylglutathione lyase
MLNLNSMMIGSAHPQALAGFYEKVLGKPADWKMEGWYGWQVGDGLLAIGKHSEVKGKAKEPQRVILNFETKKPKKEFARIKDIGAKVVRELYQLEKTWIATFADPDGNYFQIMSPWKM